MRDPLMYRQLASNNCNRWLRQAWSYGRGLSWFLGKACSTTLVIFPITPSHETLNGENRRRWSTQAWRSVGKKDFVRFPMNILDVQNAISLGFPDILSKSISHVFQLVNTFTQPLQHRHYDLGRFVVRRGQHTHGMRALAARSWSPNLISSGRSRVCMEKAELLVYLQQSEWDFRFDYGCSVGGVYQMKDIVEDFISLDRAPTPSPTRVQVVSE